MHHTHRILLVLAALISSAALGQDLAMPKDPPATTLNSNPPSLYSQWVTFGKYYYTKSTGQAQQIVSLKAQLAAAGTGGAVTVDLAPITNPIAALSAALAATDAKVTQLIHKIDEADNVRAIVVGGQISISWDYNAPTTNIQQFKILRAEAGLAGDTPKAIGFATPSARKWESAEPWQAAPGNWLYYVQATSANYVLAKDSPLSNPVTVTIE